MDYELALLSRVVEDGAFDELTKNGINADFFYDIDCREAFLYLHEHYSRYNETPSRDYLDVDVPLLFEAETPKDSVDSLIKQVKERRLHEEIVSIMENVTEEMHNSSHAAFRLLERRVLDVSRLTESGGDRDITKSAEQIIQRYKLAEKGVIRIPWPWDTLNRATKGLHPSNLVFLYGRPKTMKTWVLLYLAHHFLTRKLRVVTTSREMDTDTIEDRSAALFCEVPYSRVRDGTLSTPQKVDFFDNVRDWDEAGPHHVVKVMASGADALIEFESKLREYRADVGLFDAAYLAGASSDWKDMVEITRGLKRVATKLRIPIIASCQENKAGQVAYSDSFLQDCDVLIRLKRGPDEEENDEIVVTTPALRESRCEGFVINAIPATDFSEKFRVEEEMQRGNDNFDGPG